MWAMNSPSSRPRFGATEPSGFTLFLLFFGSLIVAGIIGILLWNSNPSVKAGQAMGTANQLPAGGGSGAPPVAGGGGPAAPDPALVAKGQQLASDFGCVACHSATGAAGVGPTWKGLAGAQHDLDNGQKVTADDAYIKESILQPDAKIVKGFQKGLMAGVVGPLEPQLQQPENLDALLAYIKSLK
jgi:cytochrome c551/c552